MTEVTYRRIDENRRLMRQYNLPVAKMPMSDWVDKADCKNVPIEIFFPNQGGSTQLARRICATCPVRQQCINYAIANHIEYGVWGGMIVGSRAFSKYKRQQIIEMRIVEDWFVKEYDRLVSGSETGVVLNLTKQLCEITKLSRSAVQDRIRNLRAFAAEIQRPKK